jgi:hypothetical protein
MAAAKKTSAPKKDKEQTSRKRLTAAERVAKLEADLAAAREKANAANDKQAEDLRAQRTKLQAQVDERQVKIAAIDTELERLAVPVTQTEDQVDPIVGDQS